MYRELHYVNTYVNTYWDAPILAIGQSLSLHALSTRRGVHDVLFLFKLLNNLVDAPELLALISFRCPTAQTRSRELFVRKHVDTRANFFSNRVHHLAKIEFYVWAKARKRKILVKLRAHSVVTDGQYGRYGIFHKLKTLN
ncbi:hypothetical protein J6590_059461 [Homalodisca vitripennis]|nr:hypothetical protein J6590_059461 [Homalodisca vitripennis]